MDHAQNDERPYLRVSVMGYPMLGLLDSGASRSIIGSRGWAEIRNLGARLDTSEVTTCSVANGQKCNSMGTCVMPIRVRDRVRLISFLVVPEVPHSLILGADFWVQMGIVPDLRHNEWHFSVSDDPAIFSIEHLRDLTVLSADEHIKLQAVIDRNKEQMGNMLGCTNRAEHVIVTKAVPIKQRYYRVSPVIQKQIDNELEEMLKLGVIEKSNSPWASPIVLVKKKDGSYRFCVDYRKLNAVTEKDSYPLPNVSDTLDKLKDARYLSSLDIKSAYWQIPMAESSKQYTAFTVPNRGLFQFNRMPFGLHNSAATWQRLIDSVLGPELEPSVFVYLDDVVIITQTFEEHLTILEEVLRRLRVANLSVNWDKCQFCRAEMKYLGYVVDRRGLRVDPDKVKAMLELPAPKSVSEVRRVVGTFSWYRRFVPGFSSLAAPITALLKKSRKFEWSSECEASFIKLKEYLVGAPILSCPDYSLPFVVQTDASGYGIGAVLTQPRPEGDAVVCFLSRSLSKQERNYSTTERECLAVLWAIEKLRCYLEGIPFTVVTDHYSLVWLKNLREPTGRLARWAVRMQQYDFQIVHRKGKENVVPDALSRSVPLLDEITAEEPAVRTITTIKDKWYESMLEKVEQKPLSYPNWRVYEGRLYKYVKQSYPELRSAGDFWKEVVPKNERREVIAAAHEPPTSGHMGVYKTYARLAEKFCWPKMRQDVAGYVKRCSTCAAHKVDQVPPADKIAPHSKPSRPWEIVSTDLMGPLPKSSKGFSYILVVTDYLSKFSLVFALRSASAALVVKKIEEDVFLLFGVPKIIICDNGVQFRSKEFRNLVSKYKVGIQHTPYYNPRANPTERVNRTLKTLLATYVGDNHRKWDVELQAVACALRTAAHETTRLSPYFVNFGRDMILSGEDYREVEKRDGESMSSERLRAGAMARVFEDVKNRLEVAGRHSAHRYNLRKRNVKFEKGQIVWRRNYVLSDASKAFTRKLAPKYVGPYRIYDSVSPWTYRLSDMDGKVIDGTWNIKDLKAGLLIEN